MVVRTPLPGTLDVVGTPVACKTKEMTESGTPKTASVDAASAGSATGSATNIFNLAKEPVLSGVFNHITSGLRNAIVLEKEQDALRQKIAAAEAQQISGREAGEVASLASLSSSTQSLLEELNRRASQTNWPMPITNQARYNYEEVFRKKWDYAIPGVVARDELLPKTGESRRPSFRQQLWSLWSGPMWLCWFGMLCKTASDFSAPIFITLLIEALSEPLEPHMESRMQSTKLWLTTALLFVVKLAGGMGLQYGVHVAFRAAMQMRGVASLAVLDGVLGAEPATLNAGAITNLQTVDAQSILDTIAFVMWAVVIWGAGNML